MQVKVVRSALPVVLITIKETLLQECMAWDAETLEVH